MLPCLSGTAVWECSCPERGYACSQESAAWQALLGPAPPDMQALRRQAAVQQPAPDLRCAMEQLAAQGALTPAELPLALELADSLPPLKIRARKPGALAAAVLVLAAQARGRRITLAIAATAVTHVGLECSVAAVFHRLRNLQQHWTVSCINAVHQHNRGNGTGALLLKGSLLAVRSAAAA